MPGGSRGVRAHVYGASGTVAALQFLGLLSAEMKAVLGDRLKVCALPVRFHQTLRGMRIVPQEKVTHFVSGGVSKYQHPRKACICAFILHEI